MARKKPEPKVRFKTFLSARPLLRRYDDTTTVETIAAELGVNTATVLAWSRGGRIHWVRADSIAVRLGNHPSELWGDDWSVLETPRLTESDGTSV